jgi:hypothetical protein
MASMAILHPQFLRNHPKMTIPPAASGSHTFDCSGHRFFVEFIPKNSKECRLLVINRTDGPLTILLPEALAGVPALAQINNGRPARQEKMPQSLGIGGPQAANGQEDAAARSDEHTDLFGQDD